MTLEQLRALLDAAHAERQGIVDAAETRFADDSDTTEVRGAYLDDGTTPDPHVGLTDTEAERMTELDAEIVTLRARIARAEAAEAAALRGVGVEQGTATAAITRTGDDPFDTERMVVAGHSGARSQALAAIEAAEAPDSISETLERFVRSGDGNRRASMADFVHVTAGLSPHYRSAFAKAMTSGAHLLTEAERAAVSAMMAATANERASLTIGSSGWSLPTTVDRSFINTSDKDLNPMRANARVFQSRTNRYIVNQMGGATHEWVNEATEVADGTPTAAPVNIDCHLGDVYVQWSYLSDQDVDGLEAELRVRISEAMDNAEAAAFETGSGSGQPTGIVTALVALAADAGVYNAASGLGIDSDDLDGIRAALQKRHRRGASWLFTQGTADYLRNALNNTADETYWSRDLRNGTDELLMGRPILESTLMDEPVAGAFSADDRPIVYGNIRAAYGIVDRIGMFAVPNPLVTGANGRPSGEQGLVVFHRTGGELINPNAAKVLEITA